jgi:hypothetical protein
MASSASPVRRIVVHSAGRKVDERHAEGGRMHAAVGLSAGTHLLVTVAALRPACVCDKALPPR